MGEEQAQHLANEQQLDRGSDRGNGQLLAQTQLQPPGEQAKQQHQRGGQRQIGGRKRFNAHRRVLPGRQGDRCSP